MNTTLVVLAAGMGSRYGGLKQMDPVGTSGEFIIDYSIYDAIEAGFNKVVFIIREELLQDFKDTIGSRLTGHIKVEYVFQKLEDLPDGFTLPEGREKPWGTGQAVLACADVVKEPFAVINADDFYGRETFEVMAKFLEENQGNKRATSMAGFLLKNTLSDYGTVSRGVCSSNTNNELETVTEITAIAKEGDKIVAGDVVYSGNEHVSMNFWGFYPEIFEAFKSQFKDFLTTGIGEAKSEFYIPTVVNKCITDDEVFCKVLETSCQWFGVTYPEDRPDVVAKIESMIEAGQYPVSLWK
ncbi:MAG: sugar phosphate nucleotidyltransferase [Kiritimatiellae bacterium]|nr:sugar phosphate nucleotidyltransferase [Kiritimatiellia bacterium]